MLNALVKKQFLEMFRGYFVNQKNGRKRSKTGVILYFLLFAGIFISVGLAFYSMAGGLVITLGEDNTWLYFAIEGLLAIVLGVFGSVFNTYAGLYLPKDNDLMFSMPIPPSTLLLSRMVGIYVMSVLYSGIVWIPAAVAYSVIYGFSVPAGIFQIILLFVLALFVTFLTCILGWFVALGAQKAKGKSFVVVLLTLVFIGAYYFFYFKAMDFIQSILAHIDEVRNVMNTWLFYMNLVGKGACGSTLSFVLCIAVTLLLFAVCWAVMSRNYSKLALADTVTKKKAFSESGIKTTGVRAALLKRELKHFVSSPVWMLNGGLGVIMMPAIAVFALVKSSALRGTLAELAVDYPESPVLFPVALLVVILLIATLNLITPASVSLEGKSIWITQSLPVSGSDVLKTKEKMAVVINIIPVVLSSVLIGIAAGLGAVSILLVTVISVIYVWFLAAMGLTLNLLKPNLTWSNEAVPVKQSLAVFIALFGSWLVAMAVGAGGFFITNFISGTLYLVLVAVLFGVVTLLLDRWIVTKGADIYEHL